MSQPSVCFSNVGEKRFIELGASFYDATRHHRWKSPVERIDDVDDDDANKGSGQHARANVQPTAAPIVVGVHYIVSQPIGAKEVLADIKICSTRLCFVQVVTNEWATTACAPASVIKIVALIDQGEGLFKVHTGGHYGGYPS